MVQNMKHITVLKNEAIKYLNINPNGIYVDGTLGGAGHSSEIIKRLNEGHLYAFDQDQFAIDFAKERLGTSKSYTLIKNNFMYMKEELAKREIYKIDGLLLDLGLSSFQIDDIERGFTYLKDTDLDMRMNQQQTLTAKEIVNTYEKEKLAHIFFVYGEEKNSFKIVDEIIKNRPLETTMDLVKITDKINYRDKGHSAKRVFQALRIAVNKELDVLEKVLKDAVDMLNPDGRLVVITFHSLEDRIVKHFFKQESTQQIPKGLPVMVKDTSKLEVLTRKPIYPSQTELMENSRSKCAKLRVARRRDI
ncbi:16S rRNA (cytosine(1402)-N(4))-methyltransferase RsmH [Mycoplasmatota bacterium]|nr:16S rRNA (cytosine(1402)-N(4))-methyltransferase RsmH [Mycoplasmatota bacterium]